METTKFENQTDKAKLNLRIIRMVAAGYSYSEIQEIYNVTKNQIQAIEADYYGY